jgi:manganese catalase
MFLSKEQLVNRILEDRPNPKAANALQDALGGQSGEVRTMMQYLFQNFNFRGKAKPYRDLPRSIATEEIAHVDIYNYKHASRRSN